MAFGISADSLAALADTVGGDRLGLEVRSLLIANPPPVLAEFYAADPALALACIDLVPRLRRTGEVLLAGFIPSRRPSARGLLAGGGVAANNGGVSNDGAATNEGGISNDGAVSNDRVAGNGGAADGNGLELGE